MPYCEECGYKYEETDSFCGGCGISLVIPGGPLAQQKREEELSAEERLKLLNETKLRLKGLIKQEEFELAEEELKTALEDFPNESELSSLLGEIQEGIKARDIKINLEKAEDAFQKYDFDGAINFANEVILIDKNNGKANSILKESQDKISITKKAFERGRNLLPDYKFSEAIEEFNKVLEINPNHEKTKLSIEKIKTTLSEIEKLNDSAKEYLKEKKYALAYKNWKRALKLNPKDEETRKSFEKIRIIVGSIQAQKFYIVTGLFAMLLITVGFWYRTNPFIWSELILISKFIYFVILPTYILFYGVILVRPWLLLIATVLLSLLWYPRSPFSPFSKEETITGLILLGIFGLFSFFVVFVRWFLKQKNKKKWLLLSFCIVTFIITKRFILDLERRISEKDKKIIQKESVEFSENFKSYKNGELIDSKPHWESSDDYYSTGWRIEDGGRFKFIHFHPSPWPGGFKLDSNYATYHVSLVGKINSLYLEVRYAILPNSDMKVYISGDNKSWVDVTENIGMHRSSIENDWKEARTELKSYLDSANIEKDVYIKFTSAAYSGSGWGAHVAEIKVRTEIEEVAKGPGVEKQKIISYLEKHITEYIRERDPESSWSIGPIQFYPPDKLLVYAETGHIALYILFEYALHGDLIMLRNLYQHARYRPDYLEGKYNLSSDDSVNYFPTRDGYKWTSNNVFE